MNPDPTPAPSDDDLDRLLARRYRDTSPEFEARWVALKRDLRQSPVLPPRWSSAWRLTGWLGALGAAAAVALLFYTVRQSAPPATELTPQISELLAMDAALDRARPLLDEETRAALLNLPATGSRQN